jgi:glycosyltransferase involved in cell wall biosynthesis
MNGYPQLGYQLGKLALHNTYPKDMLFIEKPIHDWLFQSEVALCAYMCGKFKQAVMINDTILNSGSIYHEGELTRIKKNQEFFKKAYEEFIKKGGKKVIKKVPNLPLGTRGMNLNAQRSEITPAKMAALKQLQEKMKDASDVSLVVHVNTVRPNLEKLMVSLASQTVKPAQLYIILGSQVTLTPEITQLLSKYKNIFPQMNPIKIQSNGVDYDGRLKFMNSVSAKYIVIYDESRIPAPRNVEYYLKLAEQYPDIVDKGIFGQWGWQLHAPTYNDDKEIISQWEMSPFINQSTFLGTDQHCGDLKQVDYLCGHWFGLTENFAKMARMHDKHELRLEHWKEDIVFSLTGQQKLGLTTYKCCPRDGLATCIYDPADVQTEVGPDELTRRSNLIKSYCVEGRTMAVAQENGISVINTDADKMKLVGESVTVIKQGDGTIVTSNVTPIRPGATNLFSPSDGLKKTIKPGTNSELYGKDSVFSVTKRNQTERNDSGKPIKRNADNMNKVDSDVKERKPDFSSSGLFSVSKGLKKMIKQDSQATVAESEVESKTEVEAVIEPKVETVMELETLPSGDVRSIVDHPELHLRSKRIAIFVPDYTSMGGSEITVKTLYDKLVAWNTQRTDPHVIIISNDAREVVDFQPEIMISQQRAIGSATQICLQMGIRLWILIHGPKQYIPSPALELVIYNSKHLMETEGPDIPKTGGGDLPKLMYYHPAIDVNHYRLKDGVANRKYITFVGSSGYNYLKGCDLFIELARTMPQEKFLYIGPLEKIDYQKNNYHLVGKMPELLDTSGKPIEPDHLAEKAKNKLPANLEIRANTPEIEIIYAQSKVLVVPSLVESFGRVAVEGASAGVPVVCSSLAGLKEATNGLAMYVEKSRHVGEFKKAVEEVLGWHEEYSGKCEEIVSSYEEGVASSFDQMVRFI